MERVDRPQLATFYAPDQLTPGAGVTLGEDAAHHMRVRRLEPGAPVRIVNGSGATGAGRLVRIAKSHATVDVERVERCEPLPDVHLIVPIADRDRMLWLAEKATELGITSWRPVLWRRSRSVSPRGEGPTFAEKVRARMAAALTQSENAWMPTTYPDAAPERAIAAAPSAGARWVLDSDGEAVASTAADAPVTLAVGPEGGFERDERDALVGAGFRPVALAGHVLRFETAAIAGIAVARALLATHPPPVSP